MKRFTFIVLGLVAVCLVGCGDEEPPAQTPAVSQEESRGLTLEQLRQSRQESRVKLPPPAVFVAAEPSQTGADAHTYTVFFRQLGAAAYLDWEMVGQRIFETPLAPSLHSASTVMKADACWCMTLVQFSDVALSEQTFRRGLEKLCTECGFPSLTRVSPEEIEALEAAFEKNAFGSDASDDVQEDASVITFPLTH